MSNTRVSVLSLLLVLMLGIAACGGAAEAPTEEAPAAEGEAPVTEGEAPEGEAASGSLPGEGVSVNLARATWDTGWFQAAIYSSMLEELGYEVSEPQTLDNPLFYISAARGEADFWVNGWFPNHNPFLEEEDVAGLVEPVGSQLSAGALQGYLIDKATADELGIDNIEDFKDPDIAAAFDTDGNGRADLTGCNPGWGCELVIEHHLDAYELRDSVDHVQGEYSALMADTIARFERGEPILFYTWTPNWTVAELIPGEDVVWIEVPFGTQPDAVGEVDTVGTGIPGCVNDPCDLGYPPNDIKVVANSEFLAANPAAAKLFEIVTIPLQDIADQNVLMTIEGENTEADIERHAQEWLDENREQVEAWLEEARAAAN